MRYDQADEETQAVLKGAALFVLGKELADRLGGRPTTFDEAGCREADAVVTQLRWKLLHENPLFEGLPMVNVTPDEAEKAWHLNWKK